MPEAGTGNLRQGPARHQQGDRTEGQCWGIQRYRAGEKETESHDVIGNVCFTPPTCTFYKLSLSSCLFQFFFLPITSLFSFHSLYYSTTTTLL
jgi:hypothetical protein